jgi:hypothetical protein
LKEVVAPLEEGDEKNHYRQQHWVSLLGNIYIYNNNDHGVDVNIVMVI